MPLQSFSVKKDKILQFNRFNTTWFKPSTITENLIFKITDVSGQEVKKDFNISLIINFR